MHIQPEPGKRFRVAICGGGVGGITCALALSKYPDINIEVYEAASSFAAIGAGIVVWPRVWDVLKKYGVAEELAGASPVPQKDGDVLAFAYRKSDQPEGLHFCNLVTNGSMLPLYRADFHRILMSRLPSWCKTYSSKRLVCYTQQDSGTIEILFEDGSSTTCDVLIGADGIKSRVRRTFLQEKARIAHERGNFEEEKRLLSSIDPIWIGLTVYRSLITSECLKALAPNHSALTTPTQYMGKNAHFVVYPISQGKLINVVACHSRYNLWGKNFDGTWVAESSDEEFRAIYENWETEVQVLIQCMKKPMRWAVHAIKPLDSYISERVALIGDAAHAMSPNQGSGAGQAIEDAYVLATVLGHSLTTVDSIPRALAVFNKIRQPFANDIARRSLQNGKWFSLDYNGFDFDQCSDPERMEKLCELADTMRRRWEWAWTTTLDSSLEEAVALLKAANYAP